MYVWRGSKRRAKHAFVKPFVKLSFDSMKSVSNTSRFSYVFLAAVMFKSRQCFEVIDHFGITSKEGLLSVKGRRASFFKVKASELIQQKYCILSWVIGSNELPTKNSLYDSVCSERPKTNENQKSRFTGYQNYKARFRTDISLICKLGVQEPNFANYRHVRL